MGLIPEVEQQGVIVLCKGISASECRNQKANASSTGMGWNGYVVDDER